MPQAPHGSSRLWNYFAGNLSGLREPHAINAFVLGTNVPPGAALPNISAELETFAGSAIELKGQRIDNPDFGVFWIPADQPGMALTFGFSGSGKGNLLIPAALTYGGCMMLNDPKGELFWISAERRRALGFKVANCDPFGEVQKGYADKVATKEPAMRYNPLAALHPDASDFAERAATIAEALAIDKDERGNIFNGTGRDLIEAAIEMEVTSNPGEATLRGVRQFLNLSDTELSATVIAFVAAHPHSIAADKLRLFSDMTSRTNQSTRITAKEQTKFLDNPAILQYFEPAPGEPTFSFDELATGKLTVHVVLPGRLLGSYSGFSRLMFNQGLEAVQRIRREDLAWPVTFMMDEAGTSLGKLESVEQAYGLARGAGMVLWSFYQDLSQLQRDYPKSWETFISNSACVTVTGARDQATCEYFSKFLGTQTIDVETRGDNTGASSGQNPGGPSSGTSSGRSRSTAPGSRPVLFPDEIRTMDPRRLLVLMPSSLGNYEQAKLQYFRDYRFNGKYRPDPKYPHAPASPYPIGPYEKPTAPSPQDRKHRVKIALGVTLAATLVLLVAHTGLFLIALLAGCAAAYVLWKGPAHKPGDWFINRHPSGLGNIRAYYRP